MLIDAEVRQNLICCSSQNRRPVVYPPFNPPQGGSKVPKPTVPDQKPKPPTAPTQAPKVPTKPVTDSPKIDNPSTCGNPYVVGGSQSAKGKHPWIVRTLKFNYELNISKFSALY